jgi:hypothetical protein
LNPDPAFLLNPDQDTQIIESGSITLFFSKTITVQQQKFSLKLYTPLTTESTFYRQLISPVAIVVFVVTLCSVVLAASARGFLLNTDVSCALFSSSTVGAEPRFNDLAEDFSGSSFCNSWDSPTENKTKKIIIFNA